MRRRIYIRTICLLIALLCSVPTYAAHITPFVSPDGEGAFIIEGDNINGAQSIEMKVVFDATSLRNPRVDVQGGTVTSMSESAPGTLIFSAHRGDNTSSSFEAHLAFDKIGDSQTEIISVEATTTELDGTTYTSPPSAAILNLPAPPPAQERMSGQEDDASTEEDCVSTDALTGSEEGVGGDRQTGSGTEGVFFDKETESKPENSVIAEKTESGSGPDILIKAQKSVLQRFWGFRGQRGLNAYVALFDKCPNSMLSQEPPVVLTDGKTPVRMRLALQTQGKAPNIFLSNARLVNVKKDGEKGWVITAMPNGGTWEASLIIKMEKKNVEFPLVVVPPVEIPKGITERNFITQLDRLVSALIAGDKRGNEPGQRLAYEYAITANYLAIPGHYTAKSASEQANLR